jgi:asparagine synthase (glutamine-hydrolysing)
MCGISAIVTSHPTRLRETIDAMTDSMVHRGPDDRGVSVLEDEGVALGMRRLSIVDIDGGHQPMWSDGDRHCLVFNGEIYNAPELRRELGSLGQRFRSDHSDTEVLVHGFARWGNQLWSRLNGMFAVAVWDRAQRTLTVARDRLGKKPLYISRCAGGFAIGSELKAVLCVPGVAREVDLVALEQFLAFDYTIGPRTILEGTSKLLGGCYAELTAESYDVTRYWEPRVQPRRPPEGSVAELDRLLDESTRRRLIADVPVGLFLSGGLDSTTVGYYMRRHAEDVQSFSIGFEEEGFDESRYSTLAAGALGTKHHLEVFAAARMRDLIPRIAEVLDEPMGDQSIFPTFLLSTITREHVKVALGGDGSDEILMGYRSFLPLKVAWSLDRVPPLRDAIAATASALPNEFAGRAIRGLAFARRLERPPVQRLLSVLGAFRGDARWVMAPSARSSLPSSGFDEPDRHFAAPGGNRFSASDATVLAYLRGYLQEDILVKVDRASMASSLEVRSPFLDPEVVDFALALPPELRLRGRVGKYLLRILMRGRIPDEILDRRKVGFGVPLNQWLRGPLKDLLRDRLDRDLLRAQGLFDHDAVRSIVDEHLTGSVDRGRELWSLLLFQLWYDRWIESDGPERSCAACESRRPEVSA